MKKLICLAFVLCACVMVNAKTLVTVVNGDKEVVKQEGTTCSLEFDFSSVSLEDKTFSEFMAEKDEQYLKDWQSDMAEAKAQFIKRWNKKNKKGMQLVDTDNAPYKMVIKPRKMDLGSSVMSVFIGAFAGGATMSGDLLLYQGDTQLLDVDFNDVKGGSQYTETRRIKSVFSEVVDHVWSVLKK